MKWQELREQCPVVRRWVFFDHAAVAPLTAPAQQAMLEYAADIAENGDVHESKWVQRIEEVRVLFGRLLNVSALDIAFVPNTSAGIGYVAEGFAWSPGDNVVIAAEEYPANIYPWMNLQNRGVEVRLVATRDRRIWVDDIRALIDSRTRIVSLSFVEFASGFRNDLDAIGQLCRERDIYFCVDAIQGLGVLPLDLQQTPIDFLAADGHKWLLGPEGAGIFYIRRDLIDLLHPVSVGWNSVLAPAKFSDIEFRLKPHVGRYEGGSLNVGGIHALGASLNLLLQAGVPAIRDRLLALTDYLCERLGQLGWEVYSSRRPEDKSGIVSVLAPVADLRAFVRHCRTQGVVVKPRAGRLRVSPHAYNTEEEVDRLMDLLRGYHE
jgi:selenocysteine lyase/cysteine desulfurase